MAFPYTGQIINIPGDSRTPLRHEFAIYGIDLSTAALTGQVRSSPNQGTGVAALASLSFGGVNVATETYKVDGVDTTGPVSRFVVALGEATMEGLPVAANPDHPISFPYDIHCTLNTVKRVLCSGSLIVAAGVTND